MTIVYSLDVATGNFRKFFKLLFRWKGSFYKMVLKEFLIFVVAYYLILVLNIFVFQKYPLVSESFQSVCNYCRDCASQNIPVSTVLSFYVFMILARWWKIYMLLQWIDSPCFYMNTYIRKNDERSRMIRRNLIRYLNLSSVLCLRSVSSATRKRFPTIQHLVDAKMMTEAEMKHFESVSTSYDTMYVPICWFGNLAMQARKEGYITDDSTFTHLIESVNGYTMCGINLWGTTWVSVPLVYTQLASLVVYTKIAATLFSRQTTSDEMDVMFYFWQFAPVASFVEVAFHLGWIKVANVMLNPLGSGDDDFEVNFILDRNVGVGFEMVDALHGDAPPLVKDAFWDGQEAAIPYTEAAAWSYAAPYLGSAVQLEVPESEHGWANEVFEDEANELSEQRTSSFLALPTGSPRPVIRRKRTMAAAQMDMEGFLARDFDQLSVPQK